MLSKSAPCICIDFFKDTLWKRVGQSSLEKIFLKNNVNKVKTRWSRKADQLLLDEWARLLHFSLNESTPTLLKLKNSQVRRTDTLSEKLQVSDTLDGKCLPRSNLSRLSSSRTFCPIKAAQDLVVNSALWRQTDALSGRRIWNKFLLRSMKNRQVSFCTFETPHVRIFNWKKWNLKRIFTELTHLLVLWVYNKSLQVK